ncbi:MAG: hypothetical protein U1E62_24090 [Alsobacter sp.]
MISSDPSILENLRRLHHEVATRLARESEDYRLVVALRQTIQWLERRETGGAVKGEGEAGLAAQEPMPAIEILAALARRGANRRAPSADGQETKRDAVVRILRERGEPVSIVELIELMQSRGISVGGARPQGNLSSNLSQDKRFRPIRYRDRACWWLADVPVPQPPSFPQSQAS